LIKLTHEFFPKAVFLEYQLAVAAFMELIVNIFDELEDINPCNGKIPLDRFAQGAIQKAAREDFGSSFLPTSRAHFSLNEILAHYSFPFSMPRQLIGSSRVAIFDRPEFVSL
jgi:hypothetical protein